MFTKKANKIFQEVIEKYHIKNTVDQPFHNPYNKDSNPIEHLLYRKCWIDTVQWHYEDIIRDPQIDPIAALKLKRQIDASNQDRTDMVEYIDSYFLEVYKNQNSETNILEVSKLDFFRNKITESKLYRRKTLDSIDISSLFLIIIFIMFIIFTYDRYRFNRVTLHKDGIIYKRVLNKLNIKEIDIIVELIKNDEVTTKSILNIVENTNLSYPHNIKIKDQFLRDLNLKLSTIFNINYDPIIVKITKFINKNFFNIDKLFKNLLNIS